jgi:AraC-like DNA-binding protein
VASIEPREWVRAWRPAVPGISEVFHARFVDHRYPPHAHDDWTVFTVDDGAIRYDLDAHDRGVGAGTLTLLPPGVVHDGRAATDAGFRKRVLYVGTDLVPGALAGRAVDDPDVRDPSVVAAVRRLHGLLEHADDGLAAEEVAASVLGSVRAHLRDRTLEGARADGPDLARRLRELLDAHATERLTLAEAGALLEADVPALVRSFRRAYGVTPHRYVIGRRIELGRKRLLRGEAVADVAADVGFADQSHFTRHFARHVGATPGAFARSAA